MSSVRRNIVANFAGNAWTAAVSLALIPIYIRFLGIEAYGLIGVYATLQALSAMLDLGFSATLNREMARLSVREGAAEEMRNLVRTLETVFWALAAAAGGLVLASAPFLAGGWLRVEALPVEEVRRSIVLMGAALAFDLPLGLYVGGLRGLQRQVLLNVTIVVTVTVRGFGAVLVLWLVSPTVVAFFTWQIVASALQTALVALLLWRRVPSGPRARFRQECFRSIGHFLVGMGGISFLTIILTQMDKVILSRVLTLEMFGYYALASVVSLSLYRLINPISTALYPRLTELVARSDASSLRQLYHRSCQAISVVVLPVAIVIALFSREILLLWTRSETTATQAWPILSLLIVGTALNGLMHPPYALQLAYGWTRLNLYGNIVAVLVLMPLLYFMATRYGGVGAASVGILLNSGYIFISLQIMHRRLLPGEASRWYREDVGLPLLAALTVAGAGRLLLPHPLPAFLQGIWILAVLAAATLAAAFTLPDFRARVPVSFSGGRPRFRSGQGSSP